VRSQPNLLRSPGLLDGVRASRVWEVFELIWSGFNRQEPFYAGAGGSRMAQFAGRWSLRNT
jgi:hypothetical protein